MTTDEKGVFVQVQNTIVSWKALVLVNCLNTFVHDCSLCENRLRHKFRKKLSYTRDTGPLNNDGFVFICCSGLMKMFYLNSVRNAVTEYKDCREGKSSIALRVKKFVAKSSSLADGRPSARGAPFCEDPCPFPPGH